MGQNLIKALVSKGYQNIYCLIRKKNDSDPIKKLGAKPVLGNFGCSDFLKEVLKDKDIIIHAAAMLNIWNKSWQEFYKSNVQTTKKIIEAAPPTLRKLVYISAVHTLGVDYPDKCLPLDESVPYNYSTLYARSKAESELLIQKSKLSWLILRPAMVYGPGDERGFLTNLIRNVDNARFFLPIPGLGNNYLHLIYIDDLTNGIIQALENSTSKETFILAGAEPIKLRSLIELTTASFNKKLKILHLPSLIFYAFLPVSWFIGKITNKEPVITKDRLDIVNGNRFFSIKSAINNFDFKPQTDYETGIKKTMSWYKKTFISKNSHLNDLLKGADLSKILSWTQTPFFLFRERLLNENYFKIKEGISKYYSNNKIYYSAKTNFNHWVLRKLKILGSQVEVACGSEILAARKAGFTGEDMCYDGPVKTDEDIKFAVENGVARFYFDSLTDAENVNRIAKEKNIRVSGGFRIYPRLDDVLYGPAEFYISKFGVPIESAIETYQKARNLSYVNLELIGGHIGSQIIKIEPYLKFIGKITELAKELEILGFIFKEINLGGGFPSGTLIKTTLPRFLLAKFGILFKEKVPFVENYLLGISKKFNSEVMGMKSKPVLAVEPGRSITGPMGILFSKVKVIKDKWVFLDSSKYFIPESLFFSENEITALKPADEMVSGIYKKYHLAGSSLNTADIFTINKKMFLLKENDIVVIFDAGAYSISRAVPFTVLLPPVYAEELDGKVKLIRRKGQYEDSFSTDIF